jgi:polyisoprenoid-binding protein YceI
MMFSRLALRCALALAACAPLAARALDVAGTCSVQFFGTSTLHDFDGTAPCALLAIDAPDADGRYSARAEVAVAQMDTGISARDKKMREMFEAKKFPRIVATFAPVDASALRAKRAGALPFRIVMHGVARDITPELADFSEVAGENAHFTASFELSLADFGMKAPVAMGFIRVGDKVRVVVEVDLAKKNAAGAAGSQAR